MGRGAAAAAQRTETRARARCSDDDVNGTTRARARLALHNAPAAAAHRCVAAVCGYTLVGRVAERDDYCVLFFFVRHAYVYERAVGFASCADGRVEMLEVQVRIAKNDERLFAC